ncbi:ABC transporter permease [Fulvivirga sp. M361]|uniref:ABC transporter permease n=1 Tax=Fulvivirga sp. M361 TaxID=2594266 RepID=UPI0021053A08|nr:ABC transporter permease [Fulvivirga sp. M361]
MNLLRTVLSLLGVTIGIFAIISVFTLVDSLEKNIKDSFNFLGSDILYISKMPFIIKSREEWLSYRNRPNPSFSEFETLQKRLTQNTGLCISSSANGIATRENNSFNETQLIGVSFGYKDVSELDIIKGRYFSRSDIFSSRNVVIIGDEVKKALFPNNESAIGKEIKIRNSKFLVIGVLKREGESFLGFSSKDGNAIMPFGSYRKFFTTGTGRSNEVGATIIVKGGEEDLGLLELEGEITGILRTRRGLKPKEEDTFSINRPEAIANEIGQVFDILSIAGTIIGGFSILIGGFGIANIMFVSVKERTNIIGIQKSLGAKNYFILFQFLFEAIFLSVIGGLAGLVLVYFITYLPLGSLVVTLTVKNVAIGLGVSSIIGTLSGIIPAALAARLDPVIAIRA